MRLSHQLSVVYCLVVLCLMQSVSALSWFDMTPSEVRERINRRIMDIAAPTYPVWAIEAASIENDARSTPVRIYWPHQGAPLPIILLIHGGAWVAGGLETHDNLARYLCSQVEAVVVSVGYTKAPEGKFPLQLQQCYDVLTWVVDEAEEMSIDPSRLAVVGDSAGGNIAAALCLTARDQRNPRIKLQVLINPVLDLRCLGSIEPQEDSLDVLRWQVQQYLSQERDVDLPYVSPLCAGDLRDLPDALILVAELDELRPDGEAYAEKLGE